MDDHRFDTFTRAIGHGFNRRAAFRAIAGSAIGLAGLRRATAQTADCAAFCRTVYPAGRERGQCISAASNGTGLCIECGGDATTVCTNADGSKRCPGQCSPTENFDTATCQCDCDPPVCLQADCGLELSNPCGNPIVCPPCDVCADCTPLGSACDDDTICCSGSCQFSELGGECTLGSEEFCLGTGEPCVDDSLNCCVGTCASGCCICTATGDSCTSQDECCLGYCAALDNGGDLTCCNRTDNPCSSNADCCGGHCVDSRCGAGASGTPCQTAGDCIFECGEDGLCACTIDDHCYDANDCCAGYSCQPSDFAEPPFTGVCAPAA